jgi:hypothetical protein
VKDVVVLEDKIHLACSHMKCIPISGLSAAFVSFPKFPRLFALVRAYVKRRQQRGAKLLFTLYGSGSHTVMTAFSLLCKTFDLNISPTGAHGFRRGVASVLERMGIALTLINFWLGWTPDSK